ncbi:MAG: hypothetical protein AAFY39_03845 [Pseudomonadota bacterium]
MTEIMIILGTMLLAGAMGYWFGQSKRAVAPSPQESAYSAEILRLRRRASSAERAEQKARLDLERHRRKARKRA